MAKKKAKKFYKWWEDEKEEYWDSGLEAPIESCSLVKCPIIYLLPEVVGQIQFMMKKYPKTEWAADLLGEKVDNDFYITGISVFKQTVTSVTVKREEPSCKGAIGVTHSHHTMGNNFSGTDDDYPNSNHDLSGVISISDDGENLIGLDIKFTVRVETPCGKKVRFDEVPVRVLFSLQEINLKGKITEEKQIMPQAGYYMSAGLTNYL
ncbi:MAG: hypothetical protein KAU20_05685 [Nanoarchaeota archaeon]|nr:hypothetical protein [Nanoarchaeota archaeon]